MRSPARTARAWGLAAVWALLLCFLTAPAGHAAPTFPTLTGRVVDDAHVLSPQIQADLTQRLNGLEAKTSRQLIVVTVPSLQGDDIADYGYQLGRAWGIGQKSLNNGALFLVAPTEHKVRIEVGYGLEGVLTDALSSIILQRSVLPRFRAGDIPGGVVDGTQAIIDQLSLDPSVAEQKAAQAAAVQHYSRSQRHGSPLGLIVVVFVLAWVLIGVMGGRGGRGGGGIGGFLPGVILGGLMGGGGRRDDDDWGGGGSGGGFGGGGGGSFGGGGSSGSW
jgi:uncharacterized protein